MTSLIWVLWGHPYTLANQRHDMGLLEERLDRFLNNGICQNLGLCSIVNHLDSLRSDHCPILPQIIGLGGSWQG